jgi:hypothetical protein
MAKVIIEIWDEDGEVKTIGKMDPPVGPDQLDVSPATVIGLFLHSHMADVYREAIKWSSAPQPEVEDVPTFNAPKLIVPEGGIQ